MKKLYIYLFLFFLSLGIGYGSMVFLGNGIINIGTSNSAIINEINFIPKSYSTTSNEYLNQNKRMYFESGDGIFKSEVYGDFLPDGRVDLIKSNIVNSNCDGESISYYFSGNFRNRDSSNGNLDSWGKGFITGLESVDNYFCPNSGLFSISLVSRETDVFFELFIVSNNTEQTYLTIEVYDSNGNLVELDDRVIFSNARLAIGGIINTQSEILNEFSGGTDAQSAGNILTGINFGATGKIGTLGTIYSNIKRNIVSISRGLSWNTTVSNLNSFGNQYTLINYEGQQSPTSNNVNNRGKILTLNNYLNGIRVNGERNLVLKGGNLYIRDNIYNYDNNSILTIIVLRDEGNIRNGGNVYIHPDVTNIDAVIISEGSILSYNGDVINAIDNPNLLRKQLLIYGSLVSRNTVGQNISIYNTDDYIFTGDSTSNNKYNFENLRIFQVIRSNQIITGCNSPNRITAMGNTENSSLTYAFAGRKECYFNDDTEGGLRSTHRTASTVIEYNPNLQLISPKILKIN